MVASSSSPRRFLRYIIALNSEAIPPFALWWRSTVTVTTSDTGAVEISHMGRVLMTKADPLEEPCARKLACTVLQTSEGSDPFAEFNNSHQPTRQRERCMQGFKSPGHAQRFLSTYGPIAQHFRPRRHRLAAPAYRLEMRNRWQIWQEITTADVAA
jgi:hypothetical protein